MSGHRARSRPEPAAVPGGRMTPDVPAAAARAAGRSPRRRLRDAAFPAAALAVPPAVALALVRHTVAVLLVAGVAVFVIGALRRPATTLLLLVPASIAAGGLTGGRYLMLVPVTLLGLLAAPHIARCALVARRPGTRRALLYGGVLAACVVVSLLFPLVPEAMPLPLHAPRLSQIAPRYGLTVQDVVRFTQGGALLAGLLLAITSTAIPPHPGRLARTIALTGAVAGGYALAGGDTLDGRLQALGCNPNYLGALLAVPLVACVGLARTSRAAVRWALPAAVCLAGLAETESRGAVLAALAGVVIILVQGRSRRVQAMVVLAGLWVAVAFPGLVDTVTHLAGGDRTAGELAYNSEIRREVAHVAVRAALAHPVNGVGWGMFPTYASQDPRFGVYIETHDDFLRLAAEAGACALAAFLALFRCATVRPRRGDLLVLRAVVVTFAVGMLFANPLDDLVVSTPFWIALGCLLARAPGPSRAGGGRRRHERAYDLASR